MEPLDQFREWLLTAGLYKPRSFSISEGMRLAGSISGSTIKLDCYCPGCQKPSTFTFINTSRLPSPVPPSLGSTGSVRTPAMHLENYLPGVIQSMSFTCARNAQHKLLFYVDARVISADEFRVEKIGQKPSQFDLVAADFERYEDLLSKNDQRELKSAAICHSAGYHVAAFTYLRRVFERRLEVAHEQASKDAGWDEAAYDGKQTMADRIDVLSGHLPRFLVENRVLYNILSEGIHKLTEQQCADGYDPVRLGILLILDEEIERQRREARTTEAAKSLQRLQQKIQG